MKKFKITFVVAYGKGTVEVHGGSIVNNDETTQGRRSCVHTSGGTNSDGAKNRTITKGIHIHLDGSESDSTNGDAGKGAIKVPAGVTLVVDKPEYLKWDKGGDGLVFIIKLFIPFCCQQRNGHYQLFQNLYKVSSLFQNFSTYSTDNSWTATTSGVTHHRAKCSVCGLYLDNDYVKHSYTELVNDKEVTGLTDNDGFAAVCECGVKVSSNNQGAANLRSNLAYAGANGIPVVHIVKPYWIENNKNGIHVHLDGSSNSDSGDAGNGAIKVQLI